MKKFFSIFLLFIYLSTSTEFREVLKFPILVEHYFEHKEGAKNLSLINFLCMHYLDSNNVVDKDFQKDQKLPFKSHEGISFSTAIGFIPISFVTLKSIFSSIIKKEILLFNDHLISFDVASNIWQPPKH